MLYGVFSAGDGHLVKIFQVPFHNSVFVHCSLIVASTMKCPFYSVAWCCSVAGIMQQHCIATALDYGHYNIQLWLRRVDPQSPSFWQLSCWMYRTSWQLDCWRGSLGFQGPAGKWSLHGTSEVTLYKVPDPYTRAYMFLDGASPRIYRWLAEAAAHLTCIWNACINGSVIDVAAREWDC